ncbi:hypothetical protein EAE96_008737 [Botrytis aclada]|nr:hypothetical protein EAE96_008737 [Botrytis aclada]
MPTRKEIEDWNAKNAENAKKAKNPSSKIASQHSGGGTEFHSAPYDQAEIPRSLPGSKISLSNVKKVSSRASPPSQPSRVSSGGDHQRTREKSHRGGEGSLKTSSRESKGDDDQSSHRGGGGSLKSSGHRSRGGYGDTENPSHHGDKGSSKSKRNDAKPQGLPLRGGSPIPSHKSGQTEVQSYHEHEHEDDSSDDGMPEESHAGSLGDDERPRYERSINDGERSPGPKQTEKTPRGYVRRRLNPSVPKQDPKSKGAWTREKVGSSKSEKNDEGDDNRSKMGSKTGSTRIKTGSETGSRRDGNTPSQSGKDGKRRSDSTQKKGSSKNGGEDDDDGTVVSEISSKGDGRKVGFSDANEMQGSSLERIAEGSVDDEEESVMRAPRSRVTWEKATKNFLKRPEQERSIPWNKAPKEKLLRSEDAFVWKNPAKAKPK